MTKPQPVRGYIEGYYGRLLSWPERHDLLGTMHNLGMNAYLYAPKEDACHRIRWRQDWDQEWWQGFTAFTTAAREQGITVMAGIAPGIDLDFASLDAPGGDHDTAILRDKAKRLITAGADQVCLLLDDIDPLFTRRQGRFSHEGEAHAALANAMAGHLDCPVSVVPRIYADEITEGAEGYLTAFAQTLMAGVTVFTCGSHIVAPVIDPENMGITAAGISPGQLIIWDNLYANDYCPRRMFLGRYRGRDAADAVMLNPAGMLHTDAMLLALMQAGDDTGAWRQVVLDHGVPEEFFTIAGFFDLPPDPRTDPAPMMPDPAMADEWLTALETLLWRWKAPLQREWYPFLMGLRGDILYQAGQMDDLRKAKVLPPLLNIAHRNRD